MIRRRFAAFLAAALALAASPALAGATFSGAATKVHDGDSLHVAGLAEEVRIYGIDSPEEAFPGRWKKQPGADDARAALAALVGTDVLTCERRGVSYGRVVALCRLPDGRDVGRAMVETGWAWSYGSAYCPAQAAARAAGSGFWAAAEPPVPPWTWRGKGVPRGTCHLAEENRNDPETTRRSGRASAMTVVDHIEAALRSSAACRDLLAGVLADAADANSPTVLPLTSRALVATARADLARVEGMLRDALDIVRELAEGSRDR